MGLSARVEGTLTLVAVVAIAGFVSGPQWWARVLPIPLALVAWPLIGKSYYSMSADDVTIYLGRWQRSFALEDVRGVCIGACERSTYRRTFLPIAVMVLQDGRRVAVVGIRYPVVLKGGRDVADAAVRELAQAIDLAQPQVGAEPDRGLQDMTPVVRSWRTKLAIAALLILMFIGLCLETGAVVIGPFLALFAVLSGAAGIGLGLGGLLMVVSLMRSWPRLRFIPSGNVWKGSRFARVCLFVVTLGNVALVLGGIVWVFVRPEAVEGLDVVLGSVVAGGLLYLRVSGPLGSLPMYAAR
jgi:hypothetical protein